MPREAVKAVFFRLITAAKANHVRRDHSCAASGKDGDHLAIEVAPCRVAVEAEISGLRVFASFIEMVHSQAI